MPAQDPVRDRIALLRSLMIFGIVVLHTPEYVPLSDLGTGVFDNLKALFQHAVFRATVPVLTFISGFLLFRSALDTRPRELARKKAKTILVPFLVFNLGLMGAAWCMQWRFGLDTSPKLIPFDGAVWLNAAFGLTGSPANYPLNFLRDLLALMLIAPLLGWLLRRCQLLGLVLVVSIFMNNLDGYFVLRNVMPILFYLGGMAAVREWNMTALDRYALPLLAVFVVLCACVVFFKWRNTNYLRLASPLLIWPAASLLLDTKAGRYLARMSKYSFFVFVAHAPVLLATWLAYQRIGTRISYPLYWFLAPVVTTGIVIFVYRLAARWMPAVLGSALGQKIGSSVQPVPMRATRAVEG
ncbi:acyltransferase [Massilia oculi]|uniref:Acyltransferase n=1 Tax=Massilia hydrophila TaxID=3044279 RepID=A0ABS7Y825_9BURK|nr:acyltransferase [Massilia oculi]MCA1855842.1 acyltransferase [Massilia oculi]